VAGLPSLPLSVSPGVALESAGDPSSLELELELLELPGGWLSPTPASPGKGKSLAASFFSAGVASGDCGTPLRLGAVESEVEDGPIAPATPGNGNLSFVVSLPGSAGVVPHG